MLLKQKNVFFKMEKTQNSLPGINNHNDFAKIIKNLFMMILFSIIAGTKNAKQTQMKMLGLKFLLADSRISFSKKMVNLKNIS